MGANFVACVLKIFLYPRVDKALSLFKVVARRATEVHAGDHHDVTVELVKQALLEDIGWRGGVVAATHSCGTARDHPCQRQRGDHKAPQRAHWGGNLSKGG